MLIAWLALNLSDPKTNHLNYLDVPYQYIWRDLNWHCRIRSSTLTPGLYKTNSLYQKLFFLRILLLHVSNATVFEFHRTANNHFCIRISFQPLALCFCLKITASETIVQQKAYHSKCQNNYANCLLLFAFSLAQASKRYTSGLNTNKFYNQTFQLNVRLIMRNLLRQHQFKKDLHLML